MISTEHVRLMARYSRWQNESLYRTATALPDAERRLHRGAFFGSIHGTLSHLLWGDGVWMHRFTGSDLPACGIRESPKLYADWDDLAARRSRMDEAIIRWSETLDAAWLSGATTWLSGAVGREVTKPNWILAAHFFNHQTHHRGQTHAMLTAAGGRPDDTDLVFMPDGPA